MSMSITWNPPIDQTGLTSYVIQINVNDTGWVDVETVDLNILSYTLPIAYGSNARFRIGAKYSSKPKYPVFSPIYPSHPIGPAGKSPLPTYDMLTSTKTSFNYNVRYGVGSLSNSNFALFSNSAFGTKAGKYLGAGCGNVFFGNKSGRGIASDLFTSSRNTCIGNAIAVDGTADNIVIGNGWTIRDNNSVYIGNALTNETWLNGVVKNIPSITSANDAKDMINKHYVDELIKQNHLNNVVIIDGRVTSSQSRALRAAAVVPSGISVFGYNAMQGLTNNTIVGYNAAHDMSSTSTNVIFIGSNFNPSYASDTPAHVESSTFIGNNQRTGGASNTIQIANNTIRVDTASSNINLNSNALQINSTYRYVQVGTDNNNNNTNYMNGITAFDSCPTSILSAASDSDLINLTFAKSISVPKMLLFPGDFLTPSASSEASVLLSKNNQIVYITSTHDESIDYFYINRNPIALLYPAQITTNYITGKRIIPYVTTTAAPLTAYLSTMSHYNATPANSYVPIITNASFTDLSFNAPTLATTDLTITVYYPPFNSGASSAFHINTSSGSPLFLKYVSIPLIANSYTNFYFTIMTQFNIVNIYNVLYQSAPTSFTLSADTMVEFELNNNDSNFISANPSSANYPTVTAGNQSVNGNGVVYAICLSAAAPQFSTVLSNVSVFYCSANCSIGGSTSADLIPPFKMNKGDIVSIEWVNIGGGAPISYSNIYPTSVYSWYGYAQYKHFVKRPKFINTLYLNAPIVPNVTTFAKHFINFHNDVNGFCKYNSTIMLVVKDNKLVCIDKSDGVVILSASDLDSMNISPTITLIGEVHMDIEYKSTFSDPGAIAFDKTGANVSNRIVVSSTPPLNTSILGSYTITYSITINADPSAYYYVSSTYSPFAKVTRTVIVVDIAPPVITLLGANPLTIQANIYSGAYFDAGATAVDDYDGNISSNLTMVSTVNLAALGTYTVTYNISDSSGNVASPAVRTVIVVDTMPPVITLNGANPLYIEWAPPASAAPYSTYDPGATALDNYDGTIPFPNFSVNSSSVNTAVLGTYTVTYNVSDAHGNAAAPVTRTVVIHDTTPPVITLNGANPLYIEWSSNPQPYSAYDPGATAVDNYNGDISSNIQIVSTNVYLPALGTYTVTYNVSDSNGNSAVQVSRTVVVRDTTPPVILVQGANPLYIEWTSPAATYVDPGATASDNYDGTIPPSNIAINSVAVNTAALGYYSVTYNVSDSSGNAAVQVTRTVVVRDTTPPVIILTGTTPFYIEWTTPAATYIEYGATALDNYDGPIPTNNIAINSSAINTAALGSYAVTYNVSDSNGNAAVQVTRTVVVRDTTPPVITLLGDNPLYIEWRSSPQAYVDPGATALDNYDGDISSNLWNNASEFNYNNLGTRILITFRIIDSNYNISEVVRTVIVRDTTPPVITLNGPDYMTVYNYDFSDYVEYGATAVDNYDGNVPTSIAIDYNLSTDRLRIYVYTATDSSGNTAQVGRTVMAALLNI